MFMLQIGGTFEGEILPEREAALKAFFGKVPLSWANRVMQRMVMDGRKFVPSPGELVASLRRVTGDDWTFRCALAGESSEEHRARLNAERDVPGELGSGDDR